MYCTACGNQITPEQMVCTKCGAPTTVGIMRGSYRRVLEHYKLLGILHIVYSGLICIPGFIMIFVGKVMFGWLIHMFPQNQGPPPEILGPLIVFFGWLVLIRGIVGVAAGVGLLQRAPWARILALIMGFLSLLSFPFGTALGIYTIWVLLSAGADEEYNRLVMQPHA